jgi:hypothetical protein
MAKRKGWEVQNYVTVEVDGEQYSATYTVSNGIVSVQTMYGDVSTHVGGSGAQIMASILLREFVQGAQTRGEV